MVLSAVKEVPKKADVSVMHSVASLRSALFLQAAATALFGLWRGGGGAWTIATMVVAAAAVFIGAALQPTPEMRQAALVFEGVAVAFGVIGLVVGHVVPGTLLGLGALVQLLNPSAALAFTGAAKPTLHVYGAPVAPAPAPAPVEPPVVELPVVELPVVELPVVELPVAPVVPVQPAPPTSAVPTMTILPRR